MKTFIAKTPKQLDICLKMLFAEGVHFEINMIQNGKKIEYHIEADVYGDLADILERRYSVLIL